MTGRVSRRGAVRARDRWPLTTPTGRAFGTGSGACRSSTSTDPIGPGSRSPGSRGSATIALITDSVKSAETINVPVVPKLAM